MAWVESQSMSFSARHETRHADAAAEVLERLEEFRAEMEGVFGHTPWDVAVVIHPSPTELALAHPWLPLARMFAAPASRRYFAGWFARGEIHVLAPDALAARASRVPGSRQALARSPQHEYAHLVLAEHNPALPPPFTIRTFRKYLELAWVCEGAATYLAGQTRHLRAAIARRMREGKKPSFPPSAADAQLLGGTVFSLLAKAAGRQACVELAKVEHNPALPPPFTIRTFRKYLELAWVCEGAATYLAGQTRHLRPAIARRMREGKKPSFPPSAADAQLLGGTVFSLLAKAAGRQACVELAQVEHRWQARNAIELAFARDMDEVEHDWRAHLASFSAS